MVFLHFASLNGNFAGVNSARVLYSHSEVGNEQSFTPIKAANFYVRL
jgi:hypothetical protein